MGEIRNLKRRLFWLGLIEHAWRRRSVIWLSGVRRSGKTCLCDSLPGTRRFDCEKKSVREALSDPEEFFEKLESPRIAIDEIHRLDNPSEVLKLAADYFPHLKVIATGSSTLGAKKKFKDTLTDRKEDIRLTPMMSRDVADFGAGGMTRRLYAGGMPKFYLQKNISESDIQQWMDDYWAKDVQELFNLESKNAFQKFIELLMAQSGGMFEASRFSAPCSVSAPTIQEYLKALEETSVVVVIRPFSSHKPSEIVSAPKVYGFDTGFVRHYKGWTEPNAKDAGILWEHYVLNEMRARLQAHAGRIRYWRDKRGHEVDFVMDLGGRAGRTAVECKMSGNNFDPSGILAIRAAYPAGENFVVAPKTASMSGPAEKLFGGLKVSFVGVEELAKRLLSLIRSAERVKLDDFEDELFRGVRKKPAPADDDER